jgi:hypothetical protein
MKSDEERDVTSIKIRRDVWKQARIEAINREVTLSELLENALTQYFKKN